MGGRIAGDIYRHYKGGIYNVIGTGKHTETLEEFVIYEGTKGDLWIRPVKMFFEDVEVNGLKVRRFEHLGKFLK
ncbi:DUF1653 domain-containing protein [Bacillus smithii]|uniref:DUF1653 domain-containing protein n=1 Tax=Bacillus smithii TaxID=1479 RepID=UPI002E1E9555|nr:DUF1653 domain-containing protein [Bacillus smithii]MED4929165.1 DUF1653 domain-containing protein [Bacillus smithii]